MRTRPKSMSTRPHLRTKETRYPERRQMSRCVTSSRTCNRQQRASDHQQQQPTSRRLVFKERATSSSEHDVTSHASKTAEEQCLAESTTDGSKHQITSNHRNNTWGIPMPSTPSTKLQAPNIQKALELEHMHINRTGCTPIAWHRSQGVGISKHNGKPGARGHRLIHLLDPMGKGFFAKKHQLEKLGPNDTGFARHRRREYAILCQETKKAWE